MRPGNVRFPALGFRLGREAETGAYPTAGASPSAIPWIPKAPGKLLDDHNTLSVRAEQASQLLAAARQGSPEALGQLLEMFRPSLLAAASRGLDPVLRQKVGADDLVQET